MFMNYFMKSVGACWIAVCSGYVIHVISYFNPYAINLYLVQMAASRDGKMYVFGGYTDSTMWRTAKEEFEWIDDGVEQRFVGGAPALNDKPKAV